MWCTSTFFNLDFHYSFMLLEAPLILLLFLLHSHWDEYLYKLLKLKRKNDFQTISKFPCFNVRKFHYLSSDSNFTFYIYFYVFFFHAFFSCNLQFASTIHIGRISSTQINQNLLELSKTTRVCYCHWFFSFSEYSVCNWFTSFIFFFFRWFQSVQVCWQEVTKSINKLNLRLFQLCCSLRCDIIYKHKLYHIKKPKQNIEKLYDELLEKKK